MPKFSDVLDDVTDQLASDHDRLEAQVGGRGPASAVAVVMLARIAWILALGFRQTVRAIEAGNDAAAAREADHG